MKKLAISSIWVALVSLVSPLSMAGDMVTPDTYIRAEQDFAAQRFYNSAGFDVNRFYYLRKPTPLDAQTVVRMNRDTLYSGALVDTEGGATITIPDMPDNRYFSLFVVDNDHYASAVFYESGTHKIPGDTKYVFLVQRIQVFNPGDPEEIEMVNRLQNAFRINASSHDLFPAPRWDLESMLELRASYEDEFKQYSQYEPDWMGPRGDVNENTRHLAVAGAQFLFPEKDAVYITYVGPSAANACYSATYEVPPNDAFWSITVYGNDGFMKSDNNIANAGNTTLNEDGSFTLYFGARETCGDRPNRLDITEGWNFLMRVYRPGQVVLDRQYKLPDVSRVDSE